MTALSVIPDRREQVIAGLEGLQDFLRRHPDLPLGSTEPFRVFAWKGADEENRAEVDRIAQILGVDAGYAPGSKTHYKARRDFGGGVAYEATAIASAYSDRYEAHMAPFWAGAAA